jgi:uroporphyrinogen-III synthase
VRVLVTRPEPDGERTAALLRARGCDVLVAPLLRLEAMDFDPGPGPWGALALTSANAVRAAVRHPRVQELLSVPVFAVGVHTAEAARAAGFSDAVSADGDKDDLVRLIAARHASHAPVLYLAGEERSGDLEGDLVAAGVTVFTCVAYRVAVAADVPSGVREALSRGELDGALHFSRRSAQVYVDRMKAAGILDKALALSHYCLSQQVAEPLSSAGATDVRVAARPSEADLIDCVVSPQPHSGGSRPP